MHYIVKAQSTKVVEQLYLVDAADEDAARDMVNECWDCQLIDYDEVSEVVTVLEVKPA